MRISVSCSRAGLAAFPCQQSIEFVRPSPELRPRLNLTLVLEGCLTGPQHLADRIPGHPQVPGNLLDRLALEEMLAPIRPIVSTVSIPPPLAFESKRAAHQANLQGVNFGRRSPSSGGQICTPNNSPVACRLARGPPRLDNHRAMARALKLAGSPLMGRGYEIKHDGYRIMAERDHGVRLYSRNGYDFAERFPLAAAAIRKLPVRSCLIDGEAIVCDANGLAVFDLICGAGPVTTWSCAPSTCSSSTATICGGRR